MEEMQDTRRLNGLFQVHRCHAEIEAQIKVKKPMKVQMQEEKLEENTQLIEYEKQRYRRLNDYKQKGLKDLKAEGLSDSHVCHAEKRAKYLVQKTYLCPSRFTESERGQ
ncbi:hypothetical protein F2P81_014373 [Scophthalmus maximus]|uniref:Uncharacterized protein n=1 Tax=Scophthalmus maximus TaxID=52904 RepID=A0A6A4SM82_SCOMX|nr:hypothetical protein F2P81_014373 [Scophthalmus maximus]